MVLGHAPCHTVKIPGSVQPNTYHDHPVTPGRDDFRHTQEKCSPEHRPFPRKALDSSQIRDRLSRRKSLILNRLATYHGAKKTKTKAGVMLGNANREHCS